MRRALPALIVPFALTSCFTMGLWGFDPAEAEPPGFRDATYEYDAETEWTWPLFGLRLLCTPVALLLDCATAPVQAWLWAAGDDESRR